MFFSQLYSLPLKYLSGKLAHLQIVKPVYCCGHVTIKRLNHNYLNGVLKSEEIKNFFDKLESDEFFLKEYSLSMKDKFIKNYVEERAEFKRNLSSLLDLEKARSVDDLELKKMLDTEIKDLKNKLLKIEFELIEAVTPKLPTSDEIIVEITAGVGGQEAMLFAKSLYEMYCGYIDYKNWSLTAEEIGVSDLGGIRHATLFICGYNSLMFLRQESGVHRVQRIPLTERSGRIHTSTVGITVLPLPREIDVNLNRKDLNIETKRSSGAGGQHVNTTESAVRITHLPTGISVECQTDRSQIKNREIALQKLCAKLFDLQQKEQNKTSKLNKKIQVGSSARSDKIRTYNFPQDRITDHRLSRTSYNLSLFLEGKDNLDSLISELILEIEKKRFEEFIVSLKEINNMKS